MRTGVARPESPIYPHTYLGDRPLRMRPRVPPDQVASVVGKGTPADGGAPWRRPCTHSPMPGLGHPKEVRPASRAKDPRRPRPGR